MQSGDGPSLHSPWKKHCKCVQFVLFAPGMLLSRQSRFAVRKKFPGEPYQKQEYAPLSNL
jgi:hypothetical protein